MKNIKNKITCFVVAASAEVVYRGGICASPLSKYASEKVMMTICFPLLIPFFAGMLLAPHCENCEDDNVE